MSTAYINNHDVVVLEDLRGKNLMKNHALAMSIADVGWYSFQRMLEYKADLYGKKYIEIDKRNTTQRCSNCGSIMGHTGYPKLTLKDREWDCPICKAHHIRDYNAAKNILEKGGSDDPMKLYVTFRGAEPSLDALLKTRGLK